LHEISVGARPAIRMGRSILITGAGGFIGSAVTRRLVRWAEEGAVCWDGDTVDEVCALLRPASCEQRLEEVRHSPLLSIERADITDSDSLRAILHRRRPKAILHLAFDPSGFEPQGDDEWHIRHLRPIEGMFNSLSSTEGARFVHTSSAWVLAPGQKLAENAAVLPTLEYGEAKARTDEALGPLSRSSHVPFVNLRLFNVFGPYEERRRLLPHLVGQWRLGLPAQLTHGDQIRDFNHVDDIAEAYRLALLAPASACGRVYHVGSGRGTSVRAFADMVAAVMGVTGEIEFNSRETRDRDIPALVSDPRLAIDKLSWQARADLEVRIRDAVKWWLARPSEREEDAARPARGDK
jgi:nucleoside-diphosphate-sugar epimerase